VQPVTVFLVAVACLLVAGSAVRPLAAWTRLPEALLLALFGVVLRVSGLATEATIAALAPSFAALALIIVLFEAGRGLHFGAGGEVVRRARLMVLAGAGLSVPLVALFSMALYGLDLLPVWSWTHALMLASLVLATAPEVSVPALRAVGVGREATETLEREAAITGALAIAATAVCIDLLSAKVAEGQALAAIAAGFGLGLAFGSFAGLLWIAAVRRVGPRREAYPYTLAGMIALYVVTEALGGIGALAVLVLGAVVGNAEALVAVLFRPRGTQEEQAVELEAAADFRAALDDHARTVEIVRVLLFVFIGLGLGSPPGLMAMGIALGLILAVTRMLAARLVLRGLDDAARSPLAVGWPRGMVVAGLAALPHTAAVPGTASLTTLVFSAVFTSCAAFAIAVRHGTTQVAPDRVEETGPKVQASPPGQYRRIERTEIRAPSVDEVLAPVVTAPSRRERTEIRAPSVEEVLAPLAATEVRAEVQRSVARVVRDPTELAPVDPAVQHAGEELRGAALAAEPAGEPVGEPPLLESEARPEGQVAKTLAEWAGAEGGRKG
jgi:NhaP-type Na+/H+ or K+/H+ antiporter